MTPDEALNAIHSRPRGAERTLSRIRALMGRLENPQDRLRFLHVAGSNGKGSCAAMLASALTAGGYRAGLFISPYILEFRERFQIDGQMIPQEEFAACAEKVLDRAAALDREGVCCTEFECCTALALCWFAEKGCEAVVLEAGLGGKNDATNVIPCPAVSVIMALSLEHTALLGNTLEEIAAEKAGIIKGGQAVLYPLQEPEAAAEIYARCARVGAVLHSPIPHAVRILEMGRRGSRFEWEGEEYRIPLAGRHQVWNAVTALEALRAVSGVLPVSRRDIREGLESVRFPVRFETVKENPAVVLDGAHNPQGAQVLAELLDACPEKPRIGVIGMLADKDWRRTVGLLAARLDAVLAVPVPNPRPSVEPAELAAEASKSCRAERFGGLEEALARAAELAGQDGLVCCAGSLFLAAEARKFLEN